VEEPIDVIRGALSGSSSMGLIFSVFLFVCGIGAAGALIKEESYGVAVLFFGVLPGVER